MGDESTIGYGIPGRVPHAVHALLGGRYQLGDQIGRGGMGVVYRAHDLELGELVAVKFLETATPTPDHVERLRHEVRLARRVTHRNVARIHDIGEDRGRWFLTMQLVDGASLRDVLAGRGVLSRREAIEIAVEICEGVAAAHAAGVLHLDLKPDNVMLPPGGGVVVLDFGVARLAAEALDHRNVVGTPGYMAPEQRLGGRVDERSDLYALGIVLGEMLAGSRPSCDDHYPGADALAALVTQLIAFDPSTRPVSARAVADALHGELGATAARAWIDRRAARLRLAVLPFGGDPGFTDELVDRLSSLHDAAVLAASATARFAGVDPRIAGAELGADAVVEGSSRRVGDELVITARLVETANGTVAWTERFAAKPSDLLDLHEKLARRIAEALRVELGSLPYRGVAPDEALALYMRARGKLARLELEAAVADIERAVALAPGFAPAIALRALISARSWFFAREDEVDDRTRATRAIADATAHASGFPETELACAVLALQRSDLATAVGHLVRTLELAPSQPVALEYLGRLLCEGGRPDEGVRHIELACELDPRLWLGLLEIARHFALHRCWIEYEATLEVLARRGVRERPASLAIQLRVAVWNRATDVVARMVREAPPEHAANRLFSTYAAVQLGGAELGELDAVIDELLARRVSPRFTSLMHQLGAEAAGSRDQPERALAHVEAASASGLIDLEWLDRCALLADTRRLDGFAEIRRAVRTRAAALWR